VVPAVSRAGVSLDAARYRPSRSHAVRVLQLFALAALVFPSDTVFKPLGAEGNVAGLIGMSAFAMFVAATLLGLHNPLRHRHPVRVALCLFWLCTLASYVAMDRRILTPLQVASADRWIMRMAMITGVALVAAECLTSMRDVRRVVRALTWGGGFCGLVAALQYWVSIDIVPFLRMLPGFTVNFDNPAIVARSGLSRVAGTSITAIELGVVAGMLLPLAIYLALYDTERIARKRWTPVVLIGLGIATSVSRSGVIAVTLAFGTLVALMPARQRLFALCAAPFGLTAIFMSAPGVIGTLTAFFKAGSSDTSVMARLYDYPEVERLVSQSPWLGQGGSTYMPENPWFILDNEYLKTAIELGFVGVAVVIAYFLIPFITALVARRRSSDPELRLLCAALAGAALAAGVCSITFDSLSFAMYSHVYALVIGLIGACWRLAPRPVPPPAEPAVRRPSPPAVVGGRKRRLPRYVV
jgi:cell division protein FtsW (lipid II flippase)